MSGQALRESFVTHVLQTAGLEEEVTRKVIDQGKINTILKLKLLTAEELDLMADQLDLAMGDVVTLKAIQRWFVNYLKGDSPAGNTMPSTLEGWKNKFTEESFMKYSSAEEKAAAPLFTPSKNTSGANPFEEEEDFDAKISATDKKSSKISVKLSDYPHFSGKTREWYSFKLKFESVAICAKLDYLLEISDFSWHEHLLATNPTYQDDCSSLYAILLHSTTGGDAQPLVTRHQSTHDGAKAWNSLVSQFHTEGNVDVQASECLQAILALTLEHSTPGGLSHHLSVFETLNQRLQETGAQNTLSPSQRKTLLLSSIKDKDFDATKDLCEGKSLDATIEALRKKARTLGTLDGPSRAPRPYTARKVVMAGRRGKRNRGFNNGGKFRKFNSNSNPIPNETWKKMSPEYKDHWKNAQKGNKALKNSQNQKEEQSPTSESKDRKVNMAKAAKTTKKADHGLKTKAKTVKGKNIDELTYLVTGENQPETVSYQESMHGSHGESEHDNGLEMLNNGEVKNESAENSASSHFDVGNIWRSITPEELSPTNENIDTHLTVPSIEVNTKPRKTTASLNLKRMVKKIKHGTAVANAPA